MEARAQRIREAQEAFDNEHKEPATERQINYAHALGLQFQDGITKYNMGVLLTRHNRVRHYLYGLWQYLTGKSAANAKDSSEFIKRAALAVLEQDTATTEKICHLLGGESDFESDDCPDRRSKEFLNADPKLRDAMAAWMPDGFRDFAHRAFPRR